MTELPPDPARLRVILAHLERQRAEHEIVAVYLRRQHDAVLRALQQAESEHDRQAPSPSSRPAKEAPAHGPQPGYVISRRPTRDGPQPSYVHLADCGQTGRLTQAVPSDEARSVLLGGVEACPFCRPDRVLGILD
ncbi:DUF6233 domain-containing protein [Streptomyces sp. NPDC047022]|uniref:DUF6233 domain-containing protein n=1 Tax=Streptomyces sp. NPDC047022 TaxID=3155737 RepID=UPI0033E04658